MFQFLIDTLVRTSDLALVALGLSLVYGLVKFPNIAHVQYAMLGAYFSYFLHAAGLPMALAILLSCAAVGLLTLVLHLLVFRRLLDAGPAITMIGSLALSMLMVALALGVFGSFPLMFKLPLSPALQMGDVRIGHTQLYALATTAVLLTLFAALLFGTRTGRAMRALSSNRALAAASGLNAEHLTRLVNVCSGALAALGGSMLAITSGAHVNLGHDMLLPVFAAAILGGLGNPLGAVAGAFLIALTETVVTNLNVGWLFGKPVAFLPVAYISAASFLILLLALLLKPYGLFDREVRRV
nr:branched-chain amino acid ABC transporter permease [Herbaspirillum sp. B39]